MIKQLLIFILLAAPFSAWAQNDDPILIPFRDCKKWYYVNEKGERVSDRTYDDAQPFSGFYAAIKKGGKYGFVDKNEKVIIEPQYDYACTNYGFFSVKLDGETFGVYRDNSRITAVGCGSSGSLTPPMSYTVKEAGQMGVVLRRDTIVPIIYPKTEVIRYSMELSVAYNEQGKMGVFNEVGEVIYPFELDSFDVFDLEAIRIYQNGRIGAISLIGEILAQPIYENLHFDYFDMPYTLNEKGRKGYIYKGREYWSDCRCIFKKEDD